MQCSCSARGSARTPSSATGLLLCRHAPPAPPAWGAHMHRTSRTSSSHQTGRPTGVRRQGLDLGRRAQASPAACPCPLPAPQLAQLWGEENSSFPWEPEEESFWGCSWDCASQARQRDPRAVCLPSPLPGEGWCLAASPAACAPRGAHPGEGCAGAPHLPLWCCVRHDLTFRSAARRMEMQR